MSRPRIVCLCGSTRFGEAFERANLDETLRGHIILTVGSLRPKPDSEDPRIDEATKVRLDALHLHKIDLADEVFVLNVDGYIGESTTGEVAYALFCGKPVRWLEKTLGDQWLIRNRGHLQERIAFILNHNPLHMRPGSFDADQAIRRINEKAR